MNGRKFFDVYRVQMHPSSWTLKIQKRQWTVVDHPTFAGLDLYDGSMAVDDQLLAD